MVACGPVALIVFPEKHAVALLFLGKTSRPMTTQRLFEALPLSHALLIFPVIVSKGRHCNKSSLPNKKRANSISMPFALLRRGQKNVLFSEELSAERVYNNKKKIKARFHCYWLPLNKGVNPYSREISIMCKSNETRA